MASHHAARLSVRALLAAGPVLLLPLLAAVSSVGCARNPSAELRLISLENNTAYLQSFSNAYVSKSAGGGTEIVLTDEQRVTGSAAGDAVPASAQAGPEAVRQVMHLKILWKPQRGAKQSHPSYTNAGLHWYVFAHPADGSTSAGAADVLEYSGAGFVTLAQTPAGTQVTIENATIKRVGAARGSLIDPVGPARLTGTFLAKQSPQRVNALLAEVKTATSGATIPQASAE